MVTFTSIRKRHIQFDGEGGKIWRKEIKPIENQ